MITTIWMEFSDSEMQHAIACCGEPLPPDLYEERHFASMPSDDPRYDAWFNMLPEPLRVGMVVPGE
ncbi:hypothetical protein PCA20602_02743 [Pandoraea capi]|uniref:Uncharacterized protein n=1 Tax=Pandoraea capi TaxID=2508286 RepID=A0ABY6W0Y3_9BURK|nr:hypothetical protein [Pandoraea capi]VVE13170.1 hypothetical protein PCA20602_02743 [Pandoraea capi]